MLWYWSDNRHAHILLKIENYNISARWFYQTLQTGKLYSQTEVTREYAMKLIPKFHMTLRNQKIQTCPTCRGANDKFHHIGETAICTTCYLTIEQDLRNIVNSKAEE